MEEEPGEFNKFLMSGNRVWLKIEEKGKEVLYGHEGDLIYQGYQAIGTATFLVFDKVDGEGKKAQIRSLMKNTNRIIDMGVIV